MFIVVLKNIYIIKQTDISVENIIYLVLLLAQFIQSTINSTWFDNIRTKFSGVNVLDT